MSYSEIINMYSYICSKGINGVSVNELISKFEVKKKDIINFLKVMSSFSDNINFYYYSLKEEEYIDSFENIDKDTIIEIDDTMSCVTLKLGILDTLRLYEILEDYNFINKGNENFIHEIGDPQIKNFKYINKGIYRKDLDTEIKVKNVIVDAIIESQDINIKYYDNKESVILKNIHPLGIYFDISKEKFYAVFKVDNQFFEADLSNIEDIEISKNNNSKEEDEFDISLYLKNKRREKLVLKVYKEARVVDKIKSLFHDYELQIEDEKEYFRFTTNVEDVVSFKNIIDSFGSSVIVEEPETLKNLIIEETKDIIKNYKISKEGAAY